jgi:hypothetical protein
MAIYSHGKCPNCGSEGPFTVESQCTDYCSDGDWIEDVRYLCSCGYSDGRSYKCSDFAGDENYKGVRYSTYSGISTHKKEQ